jgi:hypothetical protein
MMMPRVVGEGVPERKDVVPPRANELSKNRGLAAAFSAEDDRPLMLKQPCVRLVILEAVFEEIVRICIDPSKGLNTD